MIKWLRKIFRNDTRTIKMVENINLKNNILDLCFQLSNDVLLDKNWSLVTSQKSKSNFLSQIIGTALVGSSVTYSTNGLYIASVNTSSLMSYGNGSLSSITMNENQFGNHAGFISANPSIFTPILAVQFASMLTGQYYFKGLTEQLTSVQKGINEIINLHHNERIAKLRYINTKINELNNRNYFTTEDYVIIDRLKYDLSIIRFEYLLSAQQEIINTFQKEEKYEVSEDSNQVKKYLNSIKSNSKKIHSFLNSFKSKIENSNKKVTKLAKKINDSKFFFYSNIAIKSEQLYQLIKLLELKINLSDKNPDYNRVGKIEELYRSIITFNYEDSIYDEIEQLKTGLKDYLQSEIKIHKDNSILTKDKIDSKAFEIFENFKILENNLKYKKLIFEGIEQIKIGFETPNKILIDNRTGTTKIYTKTIANI